jgi:hypothetical protein
MFERHDLQGTVQREHFQENDYEDAKLDHRGIRKEVKHQGISQVSATIGARNGKHSTLQNLVQQRICVSYL